MDSNGRSLEQIYGPLNEGSELTLLCLSKGGRPPPAIVWRRQGHVIDDSYLTLNDFVALKLANGSSGGQSSLFGASWANSSTAGQQQLDNNLAGDQQTQQASDKLADWLAWPEFDYFQSSSDEAAGRVGGGSAAAEATSARLNLSNMNMNMNMNSSHSLRVQPANSQLIDWQVDKSTTTAANVLHLSELTRAQLLGDDSQLAANDSTRTRQPPLGLSQLECHASNVHYDLRSLIKLFAPPSLQVASQKLAEPGPKQQTSSPNQAAPQLPRAGPKEQQSAGLTQAIERAIWANLRSAQAATAGSRPTSPADENNELQHHQQASPQVALAHLQRNSNQPPVRPPEDESMSGASPPTEPNWPLVIYQQLIRPRQLVATQAAAGEPQPLEADWGGQQQEQPLARSKLIALEANLRPLDVRVSGPERPLQAGQVHEFTCQSGGSRPPARLTWLKNGRALDARLAHQLQVSAPIAPLDQFQEPARKVAEAKLAARHKLSVSGQSATSATLISQSRLAIKLDRDDHGAKLSCRAENEHHSSSGSSTTKTRGRMNATLDANVVKLDDQQQQQQQQEPWLLEDSITLDVHYSPQVTLELGTKMLSEHLREGQDIYFVCLCDAQPAASEIAWLHNDRPINESQRLMRQKLAAVHANEILRDLDGAHSAAPLKRQQSAGSGSGSPNAKSNLILSNNSLVLQRVQVEQSGQYSCLASNSEGVGLSNQIELRVLHAPICVSTDQTRAARLDYQVLAGQAVELLNLGPYKLAPQAAEPLKLICQMLVESNSKDSLRELEFTWYMNNSFGERRVLAKANGGDDVKLIDVEMELPDLLWPPSLDDDDELNYRAESPSPASGRFRRAQMQPEARQRPPQAQAQAQAQTNKRRHRPKVAQAQLSLTWSQANLAAQTGQLFCMARNSLGEQKRACAYTIEAPSSSSASGSGQLDDRAYAGHPSGALAAEGSETKQTHDLAAACLPVNVTASSAWIGCDLDGKQPATRRQLEGGSVSTSANTNSRAAAAEISQVEKNNDRLPPDKGANGRFRFQVLVFSGTSGAPSQRQTVLTNDLERSAASGEVRPSGQQLEANITSNWLDEPLFAVVNLRANTNYLLEISDLGRRHHLDEDNEDEDESESEPSLVSLRTLKASGSMPNTNSKQQESLVALENSASLESSQQRPSIRQVTEPHRADLVAAALISTRSTSTKSNQPHRVAASSTLQQQQQQRQISGTKAQSVWSLVTATVANLFGLASAQESSAASLEGRPPMASNSKTRKLAPTSQQTKATKLISGLQSDGLIALSLGITVLLVTLAGLVVLQRSCFCDGSSSSSSLQRRAQHKTRVNQDEDEAEAETKLSSLTSVRGRGPNSDDGGESLQPPPNKRHSLSSMSTGESKSGLLLTPSSKEQYREDVPPPAHSSLALGHHYSTLSSRLARQQPQPTAFGYGQQHSLQRHQHQPMINFLKSSSIASTSSSTMQRNSSSGAYGTVTSARHPHAMQQLIDSQNNSGGNQAPSEQQFVSTVTRSRSSLGFNGSETAAMLLGGGCSPNVARPQQQLRLMQSKQTSHLSDPKQQQQQQQQQQPEPRHAGKCLISDANFQTTPETTKTTTRPRAAGQQSWTATPYNDSDASLDHLMRQRVGDHHHQGQLHDESPSDQCTNGGSSSFDSTPNECDMNNNSATSRCNCKEISLTYDQNQQNSTQMNFIELLPAASGCMPHDLNAEPSFGYDYNQQPYDVLNDQALIEMIMPDLHEAKVADEGRYHRVLFNQSLNSSSLGSPATINNQFNSPPLSSLSTGPIPVDTHKNIILVAPTSATTTTTDFQLTSDEVDPNDKPPVKRAVRLNELVQSGATSTSNYSSDCSSSICTSSTRNTNEMTKLRLTSILKNCANHHSISDSAALADNQHQLATMTQTDHED